MINGVRFTIIIFTSAAQVTVSPAPPAPVAATLNWYCIRRELLRSDQSRNRIQVLWQAPVGLFEYQGCLGSGDYRIQMSPDSNYQQAACETINPGFVVGLPGQATSTYTVNVLDVKFYAAVAKMSIPDTVQELHLREWSVQSKQMNSSNMNFSFSVPASTACMSSCKVALLAAHH